MAQMFGSVLFAQADDGRVILAELEAPVFVDALYTDGAAILVQYGPQLEALR